MLWPGEFLFGYPGQKPGAAFEEEGPVAEPPAPWMRDGAFLVVRRLAQLVPEMQQSVREAALGRGMAPELLGAQMVGRWQSGAPIIKAPLADKPELAKDDRTKNDFEFKGDREGGVCPWAAHIRKTYPRDDVRHNTSPSEAEEKQAEAFTHTRRMMRRGIPFGPEVSDAERLAGATRHARGLVFKCYVTDLFEQFEFVQSAWANSADFGQPDAGVDPIIGQAPGGASRRFRGVAPERPEFDFAPWVVMTGGAYFFAPSLPLLRSGLGS